MIDEAQVQPISLVTAITPLANNQTGIPTPTFDFTATSSFSPTAPKPQAVWYQLDTWQGPWLPTSGTVPNFSATTPTLLVGDDLRQYRSSQKVMHDQRYIHADGNRNTDGAVERE